jgi:hypothetical protein
MAKILMKIQIDMASLEQPSGKWVRGQIWFTTKSMMFPYEGWHDFPVALLSAFLAERKNVLSLDCRIYFYDGPASIEFVAGEVRFYRYDDVLFAEPTTEEEISEFVDSVIAVARVMLKFCLEKGYEMNDDLQRLSNNLKDAV